MSVIRSGTNLHCPKCGNDIVFITNTVPIDTVNKDKRPLKCYWPGCGWNGMYCDLLKEGHNERGKQM